MPDPQVPGPQAILRCPICAKPADPRLRPFCSARCADVDLGRWFTGQYSVAVRPSDEEEETA